MWRERDQSRNQNMSMVVYGLATVTFGIKFTIVAVFQRRYGYPTIHILPLELSKLSQESIKYTNGDTIYVNFLILLPFIM